MNKMNTHKNLFLVLFVIACMSGLLLSSRHALTEENQQTGRKKIMSETPNPNIGKKFPEVTANSPQKPLYPYRGQLKGK